jgi:hypothetical protein
VLRLLAKRLQRRLSASVAEAAWLPKSPALRLIRLIVPLGLA